MHAKVLVIEGSTVHAPIAIIIVLCVYYIMSCNIIQLCVCILTLCPCTHSYYTQLHLISHNSIINSFYLLGAPSSFFVFVVINHERRKK